MRKVEPMQNSRSRTLLMIIALMRPLAAFAQGGGGGGGRHRPTRLCNAGTEGCGAIGAGERNFRGDRTYVHKVPDFTVEGD
jgi:hypothetical protein